MQALLHFLALIVRSVPTFFRSHSEQVIVELALRQQLATYDQKKTKPKLTSLDRFFWVALSQFLPRWKRALGIVKPDTVVRWHRKGFRLYWRWISKRGPGRPPISAVAKKKGSSGIRRGCIAAIGLDGDLRSLALTYAPP
jgi:hypothetical protein